MTAPRAELRVAGVTYGGWKRMEVQRSIEQMAGAFMLDMTHKWPGVGNAPALREGLACEVLLDGDVVVTGFIDQFEPQIEKDNASIRVEGRDKTADLVDCSGIHKGGQWRNVKLVQIVTDLVKPFGLNVVLQDGLDQGAAFTTFALEDGESALNAIDRACRMRAVLCTSTPTGAVRLGHAGTDDSGATLEEGVNIERISCVHSWRERFSQIVVKGQVAGDDFTNGAAAAQQKSSATDAEINRYRPLIVMAEHGVSAAALSDRAKWEVAARMGRGKRGKVLVTGWRTGNNGETGDLWTPNTLVRVVSGYCNLDKIVLIVGCQFLLTDQGGVQTELTFALPEAFEQVNGVGRSKLRGRLRDRPERRKYGEEQFIPSWERTPPGGAE